MWFKAVPRYKKNASSNGKNVQLCKLLELPKILGTKNLCKKARNKKFGLAKRFQSTLENSALNEGKYVRVCKQGGATKNADAKKLSKDAREKNTVRQPTYARTLPVNRIKPNLISAVRLPNFARKFSAKYQTPATQ